MSYMADGVRLLELARSDGRIEATFKLPFDLIAHTQIVPDEGTLRKQRKKAILRNGSPGRTRTSDPAVNSRLLYRLSYRGTAERRETASASFFIPQ